MLAAVYRKPLPANERFVSSGIVALLEQRRPDGAISPLPQA